VRKMNTNSSTGTSTMNTSATKTVAKRVAKKTEETPAPAPVAAVPAPAPAPAAAPKAKAVSKKATTKTEAAATPAPAPAVPAVVAATPAVEAAATEAPTQTVGDEIRTMVNALTTMRETISNLHAQLKKLDKRVAREIKDARKRKRRVRVEGAEGEVKARLSIFEIPTKLSEDLCHFLGKPKGSEMSRSNVTKAVTSYIKERNLKNKHDITPDASLRKLLAVPDGESLTYFNLQKYLNKHYIKAEKPVVAAH
jgi:chromatin remodeling complex protein RSC6